MVAEFNEGTITSDGGVLLLKEVEAKRKIIKQFATFFTDRLSFAKTRSPLVSTTWEMGCNVVEPGYKRPRRGILESDDILAKDR